MHGQQVAIHNANIDHTLTLDTQKVIRMGVEAARGHLLVVFNILLCQNRFACGYAANNGDTIKLFDYADASGGTGNHLNNPFARQRTQMVFRSIG